MPSSKPHKDKSIFRVIKIPYQTQDTEQNTTQYKQSIERKKTPDEQSVERPNPKK